MRSTRNNALQQEGFPLDGPCDTMTQMIAAFPEGFRKKSIGSLAAYIVVGSFCGALLLAAGIYFAFSFNLPKLDSLSDYKPPTVTQIYSADGQLMAEYAKERRYVTPLEEIPKVVINSFISSEDGSFFSHSGINFARIASAMIENIKARRVVQGGSTITQQVAKTMLLSSEKKISRKIKEAILASRMEKTFTKQQILYLYLNQIYLGHSAYGVEAAARTYFRKSIKDLTLAEATIIAGLPQAPSRYDPLRNPQLAKRRQAYVLNRMVEDGHITEKQAEEAYSTTLKVYDTENLTRLKAPHYSEFVRRYLAQVYTEEKTYTDGFVVHTSCKLDKQKVATAAVRQGLHELDHRQGFRGPLEKLPQDQWAKIFRQAKFEALRDKVPYKMLEGRALNASEKKEAKAMENAPQADAPEEPVKEEKGAAPEDDKEIASLESEWLSQLSPADKKLYLKIGKTPLEVGKLYKAVVTDVEIKKATVRVGDVSGTLLIEDARWARKPNLEMFWEWAPIGSFHEALKKGDVVLVSLKSKSEKEVLFFLDQEPQVEGAIYSMDIATGDVEVMVGGYDFNRSEFNRAIQAMRQAGSTFKPIIYSAGIDAGLTPATIIVDAPIIYRDEDAEFIRVWKPDNFGEKNYGDTTYRDALINSRNIPTIKIVQEIGVPYAIQYARHLGVTSPVNQDLSIALGSSSVYLHEMVQLYAIFANQGRRVKPNFIRRILDRNGQELLNVRAVGTDPSTELLSHAGPSAATPTPEKPDVEKPFHLYQSSDPNQAISPQTAYIMTELLKGVIQEGTGAAVKALGVPTAGKTGTTNEYIDAWFMGYTKHIVTGVWTGFDEERPLGRLETGARSALPIWLDYMKFAVKGLPVEDFSKPEGIQTAVIDSATGQVANSRTKDKFNAAFKEGTLPGQEKAVPYLTDLKEVVAGKTAASAGSSGSTPASGSGAPEPSSRDSDTGDDFYRKEMGL